MSGTAKYYVVTQKAVPDVLLRVVEAKRLLESEKVPTVQEAVDAVGISRSSFYKYKDDIFQFHDNAQGTTLTLTFQMEDEPGLLSEVLKTIAEYSDDPPEYPDKRTCLLEPERADSAGYRRCLRDAGAAGGKKGRSSCKNTCKRVEERLL